MESVRPPARMRLPVGFKCLLPELGRVIRAYRTGETGFVGPVAPKVFAADVGISRVTLSRIENDRAWPRPETLDRIMASLELDWPDIAIAGQSGRPARLLDGTAQGSQVANLCKDLRWGRRQLKWTLAKLSERCGISAAQLSRIERAQGGASRVFTWYTEDMHIFAEDRRVVFANAVLAAVADGSMQAALRKIEESAAARQGPHGSEFKNVPEEP